MNVKQNSNNVSTAASTLENDKQSTGIDSRNTKRNSGLFSFFKWLKNGNTSTNNKSRDSLSCSSDDKENSSSSCESLNSVVSSGTVASFSFVDPNFYTKNFQNKIEIVQQIETNTYKERLKQRDKRREKDKNLTLRKKYNLFFNRDTTLKHLKTEETTKSLPLMTKPNMKEEKKEENCHHRRTNSDSSKIKKAGAYLHVKGKRKAPPPPGNEVENTASLKRKNKRLAPKPPNETTKNKEEEDEIDVEEEEDIISNDYLKLDHGILKQVKQEEENVYAECSPFVVSKSNIEEKFWYKRNDNAQAKRDFFKKHENKYEPIEKLPEVSFNRNSTIDIKLDKKDDKRKSGLPNISELDREAAEILKKEKLKNFENLKEIPEFMKLKNDNKLDDTLNVPKRKSAKDLIAKFNAITNVTKVTVNSALFGTSNQNTKNYFGGKTQKKQQETRLETHKKRIEEIDKKLNATPTPNQIIPLIKSESVSVMKKPETPKNERKNWNCPKCYSKNEYWRIICQVCSKIKPYFDDLTTTSTTTSNLNKQIKETNQYEKILERSKTQIGFSALTNYNNDDKKREEKEKLKKMLIDMKNSLPKKSQLKKAPLTPTPTRTSIIMEKRDTSSSSEEENEESSSDSDNEEKNAKNNAQTLQINEIKKENAQGNAQTLQINEMKKENAQKNAQTLETNEVKKENAQDKVVSILVGTKETIYENIKMKNNTLNDKPLKISSSVQTTSVIQQKKPEPIKRVNVTEMIKKKNNFEPMKIKDFEDIYNDHDKKSSKIYANLAQNDQLSLFFNAPPTNLTEMKNTLTKIKLQNKNKDTIEINRLLRRLEIAISKGDLTQAADFAKELAQLKVNCSVIRQKNDDNEEYLNVDMYVEDKISHRGPFPIRIKPNQTVKELKEKVEKEFEIPINVQRWILGKELITNDKTTLISNGITNGSPIFLYLVAPPPTTPEKLLKNDNITPSTSKIQEETPKLYPNLDKHFGATPKIIDILPKTTTNTSKLNDFNEVVKQTITTVLLAKPEEIDEEYDNNKTLKPKEWECHLCTLLNPIKTNVCGVCATVRQNQPQKFERKKLKPNAPPLQQQNDTYLQLMNLDNEDLITNIDEFECLICFINVKPKEGVTLRECLHQFCKDCLRNNVEYCEEAEVKCPYRDENYSCNIPIQDREIKSLVSKEMYDKHLIKSMIQAENKIDKSFHCKTPDCKGWCIFEDNVNEFKCPVCRKTNCLTCQAIHMGLNCKQYQQRMLDESECDENAKETRKMLDEMVENGEALKCPTCQVIMMKKWGCDWLRCSVCKTEICWVTKGPRWGPDGKGDISGGCQCGVNGVKCHPKCNYCH